MSSHLEFCYVLFILASPVWLSQKFITFYQVDVLFCFLIFLSNSNICNSCMHLKINTIFFKSYCKDKQSKREELILSGAYAGRRQKARQRKGDRVNEG